MVKIFWNYSDTIFPFLSLLILSGNFKQVKGGYRLLYIYLLFTVIMMGYSNYLADRGINNMKLYHLYSLFEVLVIVPMIGSFSGEARKITIGAIAVYTLLWGLNWLLLEGMKNFNSNSASIAALIISLFCFRYFLFIAKGEAILLFHKMPSFWIVSGFLFYSITAIIVIGSYKYQHLFNDLNTHILWRLQQVVNISKFLLISIGILCSSPRTTQAG